MNRRGERFHQERGSSFQIDDQLGWRSRLNRGDLIEERSKIFGKLLHERIAHVGGRHRLPVVKRHVLAEAKRPHQTVVRDGPRFREPWDRPAVRRQKDQSFLGHQLRSLFSSGSGRQAVADRQGRSLMRACGRAFGMTTPDHTDRHDDCPEETSPARHPERILASRRRGARTHYLVVPLLSSTKIGHQPCGFAVFVAFFTMMIFMRAPGMRRRTDVPAK
jgi:hypothetical protein